MKVREINGIPALLPGPLISEYRTITQRKACTVMHVIELTDNRREFRSRRVVEEWIGKQISIPTATVSRPDR